jgi:hypothetical protein
VCYFSNLSGLLVRLDFETTALQRKGPPCPTSRSPSSSAVRPGRKGKGVADRAAERTAAEYELVDLADNPLAHVRQQLSFSMFTDFENFSVFAPGPQHDEAAVMLFDQLESWTWAMKSVRQAEAVRA